MSGPENCRNKISRTFKISWIPGELRNLDHLFIHHHLAMTFLGKTPLESRGWHSDGFGRTLIWVWQSRHQVLLFQRFFAVRHDLTSPPDRQENFNITALLIILNIVLLRSKHKQYMYLYKLTSFHCMWTVILGRHFTRRRTLPRFQRQQFQSQWLSMRTWLDDRYSYLKVK